MSSSLNNVLLTENAWPTCNRYTMYCLCMFLPIDGIYLRCISFLCYNPVYTLLVKSLDTSTHSRVFFIFVTILCTVE